MTSMYGRAFNLPSIIARHGAGVDVASSICLVLPPRPMSEAGPLANWPRRRWPTVRFCWRWATEPQQCLWDGV